MALPARFLQLCSSSGLRSPSCHGHSCEGNLIRLPKQKPRPSRHRFSCHVHHCEGNESTKNETRQRVVASSSRSGESQSLHGHGEAAAEFGRREVAGMAVFLFAAALSSDHDAAAAGGLDKYLKRKKLDPLDTYVPTVLLAQSQFQEVDGKLDEGGAEQKTKYADARSLLRTGPAASLRIDIRAVAQYAAESGSDDGPAASAAVDQCLSALEDLDSLLLQASRSDGAPVERMRKDLTITVTSLDKLLATVPAPILEKSRAIADAYKEASY